MNEVLVALTTLVGEQGKQIVELSKALAIAHEHHNPIAAHVVAPTPTEPFFDRPDRLYLTEEEEDEAYDKGELESQHVSTEVSEILRAAGIPAPVSLYGGTDK